MRFRHLVVAALAVAAGALLFAAPAQAKGALSATITGPGLATPLRLEVTDKTVIAFNALATAATVDQVAFGGAQPTKTAPTKQLGPAYQMTYDFGRSVEVRIVAYPLAEGGPLISVPAGQRRPFDNAAIPGGWLRGDSVLARRMVNVGVPLALPSPTPRTSAAVVAAPQPAASTSSSAGKPAMGIAVGLGALALGALAVWRLRRRSA